MSSRKGRASFRVFQALVSEESMVLTVASPRILAMHVGIPFRSSREISKSKRLADLTLQYDEGRVEIVGSYGLNI